MEREEYKFQKLTPINDIELGVYEDAMKYIFENNDIRNIAITGAYSSGKSSVLESYKNKSNLKFIRISLAHFCSFSGENNRDMTEAMLERKIINQLIQHIDLNKIPQTNFKVKRRIKQRIVYAQTLMVLVFWIAFLHYKYFDEWSTYILGWNFFDEWSIEGLKLLTSKNLFHLIYDFLDFTAQPYSKLVSGGLLVILGGILLYLIINALKNYNFLKKIKLQTYEIELFEKEEESYFDKYLNDVLYLFENANENVIVFEDMDRFEVHSIFERLREVNILVNIRLEKANKPPLRFFYLLRDDIFQSKERTKFFDYILPIVPVMDSSNSYDALIKHFEKGEIIELFEKKFLQDISLYIDDMRLLKNIYNEFRIYYSKLNTTELNPNKMLAMIVYKNLFPQDFSDLQLNKGLVFALFDKKNDVIQSEVNRLENEVFEIREDIDKVNNECLESIKELDVVYEDKRPIDYYGYKKALSSEDRKYYEERKKAINIKLNNQIPVLEEKIGELQKQILEFQHKTLSQLITRENEEGIFSISVTNEIGTEIDFNSVKGNDYFSLLKYLIRNGHIDETYADYMTYFNGESISCQDKVFLRSITDRRSKEYTYALKDPQKIVSRLRIVDFDQEEVLNFDLLEHLLKTPENTQYLNRLLLQLRTTNNFKFIKLFIEYQKETPLFIRNLNLQWPDLFSNMLEEEQIPSKLIKLYSLYTIYYLDSVSLELVNRDNILGDYISNCEDYLNIENPNIKKLIAGFKLLNVSFKQIDYDTANKDLFNSVYQNSLYKINFNHLKLILEEVYRIDCIDDIYGRNYTSILSQTNSPLTNYIQQNLNDYIECLLANIKGEIYDDEYVVALLLNDESIEMSNKQQYIKCLTTRMPRINDINDRNLWKFLVEKDLIDYSEENVGEYFMINKTIDSHLINWINRSESLLDFSKIGQIHGEDVYHQFFDSFIITSEITNSKYKALVSTFKLEYRAFEIEGLLDDKITILIDEEIIIMNLKTLEYMRELYPNQVMYFIGKNFDSYIDLITSESFKFYELLDILSWDVKDEAKLKLLKLAEEPLSIINKGYSNRINEYILNNNLNEADLLSLFETYDQWSPNIKKIIYLNACERIRDIIENTNNISDELIFDIISYQGIDFEEKIDVFISLLPKLNKERCKKYLSMLNLFEYLKIFEQRTRPKFKIDNINNKLLTALTNNNWIKNFEVKDEYYRIVRKDRT